MSTLILSVKDRAKHRACSLIFRRRVVATIKMPSDTSPKLILAWCHNTAIILERSGVITPATTHDFSVVEDLIPYMPPKPGSSFPMYPYPIDEPAK